MKKSHIFVENSIGGFLGLELGHGKTYHPNAFALNSGRSALEFLLRCRTYKKIYIPFFTCKAIEETAIRVGIQTEKYFIDKKLEPDFDLMCLRDGDAFIYTNYFGIKNSFIKKLAKLNKNIIIDNSQAFFDYPVENFDTFYSPRKFFGVPDGGYAYTTSPIYQELCPSYSPDRMLHLLYRLDKSVESSYQLYLKNEIAISNESMAAMSQITKRILESVNYEYVKEQRRLNFSFLHSALKDHNKIANQLIDNQSTPLSYPLLSDNLNLRKELHKKFIFTPVYWPEIINSSKPGSFEHLFSTQTVHLPIDRRYKQVDMEKIIQIVMQ